MSFRGRRKLIFTALSLVAILKMVSAYTFASPEDIEATLGSSVTFNCSSGAVVQWNVHPVGKPMEVIAAYGKVNAPYVNRFAIQNGHLRLSAVTLNDAGTYECRYDQGITEKTIVELIILESNLTCQCNSTTGNVDKKTPCVIKAGPVTLTCTVQFHGKRAPILEWTKTGNETKITSGVSNEIRGNLLLQYLTIEDVSIVNGSSYTCRSAKAAITSATCMPTRKSSIGQTSSPGGSVAVVILIIVIIIINAITASFVWYLFIEPYTQTKNTKEHGRTDDEPTDTSNEKQLVTIENELGTPKTDEQLVTIENELGTPKTDELPAVPLGSKSNDLLNPHNEKEMSDSKDSKEETKSEEQGRIDNETTTLLNKEEHVRTENEPGASVEQEAVPIDINSEQVINSPNENEQPDSEHQTSSKGSRFQLKITRKAVFFVLLMAASFWIGLIPLIIWHRKQLKNEKEPGAMTIDAIVVETADQLQIAETQINAKENQLEECIKLQVHVDQPQNTELQLQAKENELEECIKLQDQLLNAEIQLKAKVNELQESINSQNQLLNAEIQLKAKVNELEKSIDSQKQLLEREKKEKDELNAKVDKLRKETEMSTKDKQENDEKQKLMEKVGELERRLYLKENQQNIEEIQYKQLGRRLYSQAGQKYANYRVLLRIITTTDSSKKEKPITGLAILGNDLFVLYGNSPEIEVYSSATYEFARKFEIPKIQVPFDLTAGKADRCLFALGTAKQTPGGQDEKGNKEKQKQGRFGNVETGANDSVIVRFDARGKLFDPWPKSSGGVSGQLSTYGSNLVVCVHDKRVINEFSQDGDLIHSIQLSSSTEIQHLLHAIKVTSTHYAVSHGQEEDTLHRMCIIDVDGNMTRECREWDRGIIFSGQKFKVPIHFIEDDERSLLVADQVNNRILMLKWDLTFPKTLIPFHNELYPVRLCLNESQNVLFVARNRGKKELKENGVSVYQIK